jgi:tetratricopeptide (TPR) repeat protein
MRALVLLLFALPLATATPAVAARKADGRRVAQADVKQPDKAAPGKPDRADAGRADKDAKQPEPPPAPSAPPPGYAEASRVLDRIVAGPDAAARKAAIEELNKLAPTAIEAIGAWVQRAHATEQADRRKALGEINAAVPDKAGRFPALPPGKKEEEVDWLKALFEVKVDLTPHNELMADVAAIRALAGTRDPRAATAILDIAFGEDTIIYRDECGRYVRKMEPYSVPALTRESQAAKDPERRRYATWQLERLDRQDPLKALSAAAGDERLTIAVLDAFRETRLREAVHAVWTKVGADSPAVRAAARAAWTDYITGPPPPPAPRKKLQLPGGKLTKKPKPLWLTYRELADNELRQAANELLGEDYPLQDEDSLDDKPVTVKTEKVDLEVLTRRLFDHFDGERAKKEAAQWAAAKAKAEAGDLQTAAAMLDRLIATNPDRGERAEMAAVYARWGKQLEDKQQWAEASAAYSKAHGLDPKAAAAGGRLAAHHYTLGKALEAQGKDGGPDYRKAIALKPDYAPAKEAAVRTSGGHKPTWMIYAAIIALILAGGLFAAAMVRRRAAH